MLLTEEEARGKLCVTNPDLFCEAAKCMGWKWHELNSKEESRRGFCGIVGAN